ncbi:hypothetical protein M2475_001403 [Breznakia sp. PF5-3]|uniref:DUF2304 domain-containing protein n=1 Tax=unclassified Breznakia TaxID=2623764 RepID=UPI0024055983|nr:MULTISPECIES: DUF2304 domain-containing protein [unclassified Breznakia]MDF9824978.1 hypothetical protein [Breznakia sp. PM6-1]MDF9835829.1 hypothetical protein [Breznakia sp. PF5-3]MDF9836919.1 hypothetical protein [Breznakia sp. PFB2-8]MDF9859865.1 hypothetical protein [Breznakia sp. PH5-24]
MSYQLQFVFILASLATLLFVIRRIRKHKLNIDDAIIWMIWAILLLILSVFPNLAMWVSRKLGFISTSNFILSLFTFFLYIILFMQMITISSLKEKNKELIQKLSLLQYKERKEKSEKEKIR